MRKPFRFITAPLLGLILIGLVSSELSNLFPSVLRFLIVLAATVFLPGRILATRLFRISTKKALVALPIYFFLGLSAVSVVTWFAVLLGIPFSVYLSILQVVLFLFFAAALWRDHVRSIKAGDEVAIQCAFYSRSTRVLYGLVALFLCLFFFHYGVPLDYNGDHYDHIGFIRTIAFENDMDPAGVLAPVVEGDVQSIKSDPRKGVLHPYLTAVAILTDLSPQDVWNYLPLVLGPVVFLAFLLFTSEILPPGGYRFACVVLFLLFYGGLGLDYLSCSAYGQNLTTAYCWVFFTTCLAFARSRRVALLAFSMLLFWGGSVIHIGVLPRFLLIVFTFAVFPGIFGFGKAERVRIVVATFLVAVIVVLWKLTVSYQTGNLLHVHPQGLLYFGSKLFIVSPVEIIKRYGLVFWGGIVIIPLLFLIRSHWKYAKIHLALSVFPIILCFNPVLTPVLYGKVAYMTHRLVVNIPALQITVLLIGSALFWARRGTLLKRLFTTLIVFVWAIAFLAPSIDALKSAPPVRSSYASVDDEEFEDMVSFFKKRAPRGCVVVSDPVTSYRLSARAEVKVVAVLHQHGNPNDPYGLDRLKAVRDVLSPYTTQEEALAAMERYNVTYVICNGASPQAVEGFLTGWDPNSFEEVKEKFNFLPETLKKVYESSRVVIYERTGVREVSYKWYPQNPYLRGSSRGRSECRVTLWDGAVEVRKVEVEPKIVLPGEKIYLRITYEKIKEVPFSLPLKLYVRFDHNALLAGANPYPGEKIVRRWKERRSGQFLRFRADHTPFRGMYAPDIWPIGGQVAEEISFDLPEALKPGDYSVRIKLIEDSLVPNHSYRNFLYNEDDYSGPVCASFEVREFVVR